MDAKINIKGLCLAKQNVDKVGISDHNVYCYLVCMAVTDNNTLLSTNIVSELQLIYTVEGLYASYKPSEPKAPRVNN